MTGLRAGELWGLKWDDIDWRSKQIYVRSQAQLLDSVLRNSVRNPLEIRRSGEAP